MSKAKKQYNNSLDRNEKNNPYEGREGLVYNRVSSKRQETDGSGLKSQEGRCKSDLESIGVNYVKTFPDSYSGGGDFMKRPAMRELLEYIDNNPHKKFLVIFDDLSRFARDVYFHIKLRAEFRKRDVTLRCLNYNFDESEEGEFAELIFAGKAELDRKQNRRQVIQKQKARLELGCWAFGSKKGYKMTKNLEHGKICIPTKEGLEILKPALEGFANGNFVHKVDVCKFLVEKGFWTKQKPERYIDKLTLILNDPFYAGYIEYLLWDVSRRKGKHKGIISLETFETNQKRLSRFDAGQKVRIDMSSDFPLRGLLRCGTCKIGHVSGCWSKGRSKRYAYYFCQNKKCSIFQKSISVDIIQNQFEEILKEEKLGDYSISLIQETFDKVWKEEIDNLRKLQLTTNIQKINLENKLDEITTLILSTHSNTLKRAYERQLESISTEIDSIESINNITERTNLDIPYRTAIDKVFGMLKSPYSVWVNLSISEQHKLFYFIFDEKLLFSVNEPYQTAQTPSAIRLFESFATSNTHDVEMAGIEPACKKRS